VANKKFIVELSETERARLKALISKGRASANAILKARILLKSDQGEHGERWKDEEICEALDTNISMVTRVREKLVTQGLDAVLSRKKRLTPPIKPIFDGKAQAQLTALACSGAARGARALVAAAAGRQGRRAGDRPCRALQHGRPRA
jgi:hypothetical protein